jgi:hypothetical protein
MGVHSFGAGFVGYRFLVFGLLSKVESGGIIWVMNHLGDDYCSLYSANNRGFQVDKVGNEIFQCSI